MRHQVASLENGVHIVVGTPGRLLDHLERGSLKLDALNTLVLDEADRMLDMGFFDDIVKVAQQCPPGRQTLLFSATFPEGIEKLARQFQRHPQEVKLPEQHEKTKIRQRFYEVQQDARLAAVATLLKHYRPESTLAFCNTKQQCRELVKELQNHRIHALTLNGDMEQRDRDQVLIQFANRSCSVLVATDVAARGLDIEGLAAVINVDVTPDPEIHVHRIGRTGRADQDGWALSLFSPADRRRVTAIADYMKCQLDTHTLGSLQGSNDEPLTPPMATLLMLGGRKEKIRPGDVLGALTSDAGGPPFTREQVGKITVTDQNTYIAVRRGLAKEAIHKLQSGKVKGRSVKVKLLAP
jgi:ATP-independent RNA helicase DbpA